MALLTNPWLNIGAGLLAASGPSLTPVSPWSGVTRGLLASQKMRDLEQQRQLNALRLEEAQRAAERQQRLEQWGQEQGGLAAQFPELYAKSAFETMAQAPSVWVQGPQGETQFVTPQQAAALAAQGYRQYDPTGAEREYERAVAQGFQGSLLDFKRTLAEAGASSVSINEAPKPPTGYMWTDPANPQELAAIPGGPATRPTEGEAMKAGQRETAVHDLRRLKELYAQRKIDVGPVAGRALRASASTGIDLSPEEAEAVSLEEGLSNTLLQAMRGAQVGPAEQKRFERQLPRLDQPDEVFKANIERTLRNLETLEQRRREMRSGEETPQTAPPVDDDPLGLRQ